MTFKLTLREDRPATIEEHRALRDSVIGLAALVREFVPELTYRKRLDFRTAEIVSQSNGERSDG